MNYNLHIGRNLLKALVSSLILGLSFIYAGLPSYALFFSVVLFILVFMSSVFVDMLFVLYEYKKMNKNSK